MRILNTITAISARCFARHRISKIRGYAFVFILAILVGTYPARTSADALYNINEWNGLPSALTLGSGRIIRYWNQPPYADTRANSEKWSFAEACSSYPCIQWYVSNYCHAPVKCQEQTHALRFDWQSSQSVCKECRNSSLYRPEMFFDPKTWKSGTYKADLDGSKKGLATIFTEGVDKLTLVVRVEQRQAFLVMHKGGSQVDVVEFWLVPKTSAVHNVYSYNTYGTGIKGIYIHSAIRPYRVANSAQFLSFKTRPMDLRFDKVFVVDYEYEGTDPKPHTKISASSEIDGMFFIDACGSSIASGRYRLSRIPRQQRFSSPLPNSLEVSTIFAPFRSDNTSDESLLYVGNWRDLTAQDRTNPQLADLPPTSKVAQLSFLSFIAGHWQLIGTTLLSTNSCSESEGMK